MVTNKGTGLGSEPIAHDDVIEVGRQAGARLGRVLSGVLARLESGGYSEDTR